mgnify:CR=1 FL=1
MKRKRHRVIIDDDSDDDDLVAELAAELESEMTRDAAVAEKPRDRIGDIKALCNSALLCLACGNKATDLVRCCETGRSEWDRGSSCVVCASCFRYGRHIEPVFSEWRGCGSLRELCRICPLKRQRQAKSGVQDLLPGMQQRFAVKMQKWSAPLFDTVSEVLSLAEAAAKDAAASEKARALREERVAEELRRSRKKEVQLNLQLTEAVRRAGGGEGLPTLEELEAELDTEIFSRTCDATQRGLERAAEKHAEEVKRVQESAQAALEKEQEKSRLATHQAVENYAKLQRAEHHLGSARADLARANSELEEASRETLCGVCLTEKKNTVFLPCFHLASCATCAERCAQTSPDRCPICRVDRTGSMRVFVA